MTEITLPHHPSMEDLIDIADGAMSDYESRCNLPCTHSWYDLAIGAVPSYSLCFVAIDGAGVEFPVLKVDVLPAAKGGSRLAFTRYDCRGSGLMTQYFASDVERALIATLRAAGGAK